MSHDPMDELLELENTFYQEGYELGIQDGSRTGRIEGRLFGITSAFEKFSAMGNLHGRSVIWSAKISGPSLASKSEDPISDQDTSRPTALPSDFSKSNESPKPVEVSTRSLPHNPHHARLEKHIRTLYALTEPASLSTDNTEDAVSDFNDRLKRAEGKAKIIERFLDEGRSSQGSRQSDGNLEMDFTSSHPKGPKADRGIEDDDEADFLVFDQERASEILGPSPSYEFIFEVSEAVHEAPVYVTSQNKLYLSQLAPPPGYLPQLVVDLNQDPPTLSEYLSDPPVYAPNGGTFYKGLIYWGASGGNNSIGGLEQRPSLRTLDPSNNKSTTILNNYFGYYFNTVDDLFVHPNGDIWFTDPDYSWFNKLTDTPPQLPTATYRFRPSTGAVTVVEDTLLQPNGIALAPDNRTVYISDTGAVSGPISPFLPASGSSFNATSKRTIYAFDLSDDSTYLTNKRAFYLSPDWAPDGLKVAANGYVLTGAGKGVDVLSQTGELLVRVQTNYKVQNFAWVGEGLREVWMMGEGGISRVRWGLKGQELV
ncbi:MAG: hypothetical protein Q9169_006752 [Polycauliona sp. 2 TL-2023]